MKIPKSLYRKIRGDSEYFSAKYIVWTSKGTKRREVFIVEDDAQKVFEEMACLILQRELRFNFKSGEDIESKSLGFYGEYAFQTALLQRRIPCIATSPLLYFKKHKPLWDFEIPKKEGGSLTIEIKTAPYYSEYLIINKELWDAESKSGVPNYVIALKEIKKFEGEYKIFEFMGYIEGTKIKDLDQPYPNKPCPNTSCYCCEFKDLPHQDSKKFWNMLAKDCLRLA